MSRKSSRVAAQSRSEACCKRNAVKERVLGADVWIHAFRNPIPRSRVSQLISN
jgi:hypothetical protein